jgi:hypothetical protein
MASLISIIPGTALYGRGPLEDWNLLQHFLNRNCGGILEPYPSPGTRVFFFIFAVKLSWLYRILQ